MKLLLAVALTVLTATVRVASADAPAAPAMALPAPSAPSSPSSDAPAAPAMALPAPSAPSSPSSDAPSAATAPAPALIEMSDADRQYFVLGYSLSRAAFSYADLAKRTVQISKHRSKLDQVNALGALEPQAFDSRAAIKRRLDDALAAIQTLKPTPGALAAVQGADDEYAKPLLVRGDAEALQDINPAAGRTLAALDEFERTSALPEAEPLHRWLNAASTPPSGRVWYAEGLIAGVADIAAHEDMPELLPTVGEIATDLRGLRDWIVLRLPDQPSPDQAALKASLDDFLKNVGKPATQKRPVTEAELSRLGKISQQLVAQVLPPAPAAQPATASASVPATVTAAVPSQPATPSVSQPAPPAIRSAVADPAP